MTYTNYTGVDNSDIETWFKSIGGDKLNTEDRKQRVADLKRAKARQRKNEPTVITPKEVETKPIDLTVNVTGNEDGSKTNWVFTPLDEKPVGSKSTGEEKIVDTSASTYHDNSKFNSDLLKELEDRGYTGETAKALVSQMALETGHGAHMAGNYNYGNITAGGKWTGETAVRKDNHNGKLYTFRSHADMKSGMDDYISLIRDTYGILPGDSKETVYAKLTGQNHGGRKWAEASGYTASIDRIYNQDWE